MFAHEDVHHLLGSVAIEEEVPVSTYWEAAVPLLRRRRSMSVCGNLRTHALHSYRRGSCVVAGRRIASNAAHGGKGAEQGKESEGSGEERTGRRGGLGRGLRGGLSDGDGQMWRDISEERGRVHSGEKA